MKKFLTITIIVIFISVIGGGVYYVYFYSKVPKVNNGPVITTTQNPGFSPFNGSNGSNNNQIAATTTTTNTQTNETNTQNDSYSIPKLRKLSSTPVAGFVASSTASSTSIRFIDRGTGHIYEASNLTGIVSKISNTTLPKIYEAYGNRAGNQFVYRYLKDDSDNVTNFYTELRKTGSSTTETPFELKGKYLSSNINQVVVSPNGDKIFTWNIESGKGIGYISTFDEKNKVKIADTPLNQIVIDWPEISTVNLTTKASGVASGYMYTIDVKTGSMKNVLGPKKGLSGKMSRDLSKILYSTKNGSNFLTYILNIKTGSSDSVVFKTLADKCVWSTLNKDDLYCGVPTDIPDGIYPDDWYMGKVSFSDQIWHLNTTTGEVHLIANLLQLSNSIIDSTNLTIDKTEETLYFINKNDLSLWALDLNQ